MTPHERFLATMHFRPVDRPMLWEWGPWESTLRRWRREEPSLGDSPPQLEECDRRSWCSVDMWMRPRYPQEILSEDDEYVTRRTEYGQTVRVPKSPDTMSMPEHIDFPVQSPADWRELKKRFDPSDPGRFGASWLRRCGIWREQGTVLTLQTKRSPSLFGFVRELLGPERALYAFYDEPQMVEDMMETLTELVLGLLPKVMKDAPLTSIFFWEDMCYKAGPLISPAMFRKFMTPRYRRITDAARRGGIDVVFIDSDGDVSQLIPLWIEAGVNGVYPMEVAAGMDVVALRKQYGRDLLMTGGFDKRVLARDRAAIDAELRRTIPLVEQEGYIHHLDHNIPHDVPYANFCYYWEQKKRMLGMA